MDLGKELADYDGGCGCHSRWEDPPAGHKPPCRLAGTGRMPMANRGRLADLAAQGFNRTPSHPGQIPPMWRYNDDQTGRRWSVGDTIAQDSVSWVDLGDVKGDNDT